MATLGIAMMLLELANRMAWLTGGADGLGGVVMWPLLAVFEFDIFGRTGYCYAVAVVFASFLALRRIIVPPFGLSLRGVQANRTRRGELGPPVVPHPVDP